MGRTLINGAIIALVVFTLIVTPQCRASSDVKYLQQGERFSTYAYSTPQLHIFCYEGRPKYVINIWQSVFLEIDHKSDAYTQYDGATPDAVRKEHDARRHSWSINHLFAWKQRKLRLNPFDASCVGVESREKYNVLLNVLRIDFWKVLLLVVGIGIFLSADRLSRNNLFYYLCGISLGVCTSFLVVIYLLSRLFPRKPVMYGALACGWTVGIYIAQILLENIRLILIDYRSYLIWYTVISGFISFIVCYRYGPVTNERTRNLIRWTLQLVGLIAIFFSTQFQEAAMGQIVMLLLAYNIPSSWLSKPRKYWKARFPPKVKLLNNDEYYEQGVRETSKALAELREFCSSPRCNQWQTALKIKDVKRYDDGWCFASFIEGNSHLSDDEVLDYETSIQQEDLTDDDDDNYTDEED